MSAGHTPGPWFYRCGDEWSHSVVTHHGELPDGSMNCWEVASINKQREPEHVGNARLIASAPDMLAALQAVLHDCEDLDMVSSNEPGRDKGPWLMAIEAITKATGSSS